MRIPRTISGVELVKALKRLGYEVTRQTGSHIRLTLQGPKQHHLTVPNHDPIKVGTLAAIIGDVSAQLDIGRDDLIRKMFS